MVVAGEARRAGAGSRRSVDLSLHSSLANPYLENSDNQSHKASVFNNPRHSLVGISGSGLIIGSQKMLKAPIQSLHASIDVGKLSRPASLAELK